MDFSEAFGAPITENIGGQEISFPIVPVTLIGTTLAASAKAKKKERALQTIRDFGLTGQEKLVIAKDASTFYFEDIHDYVGTPDGSIEAISISLGTVGKKPKQEVDVVLSKMEPYQINRIALLVTQFAKVVPQEEPKPEEPKESPLDKPEPIIGFGDPDPVK